MSRGINFPDVWKVNLVVSVDNFVWNFAKREIIFEKIETTYLFDLHSTSYHTRFGKAFNSERLLFRRFVFKEKKPKNKQNYKFR